jgi:hypothetical protein
LPGGGARSTFSAMRVMAPAVALASVLVLVLAAAAPAKVNDDVRTTALHTVRTGVEDALALEGNALKQWNAGNKEQAKKELENAEKILDGALPAADALTPPVDLSHYVPDNSWERLGRNMRDIIYWDKRAMEKGANVHYDLLLAAAKKRDVYTLVNNEITHPVCLELINLRGPITVNGVPQGSSQLSVDVSCTRPVQKIVLMTPNELIAKLEADNAAQKAFLRAPSVVEIDLNGAKSGGVTIQTSPDAAAPNPVDDVVQIKGDSKSPSTVEVFDEVM